MADTNKDMERGEKRGILSTDRASDGEDADADDAADDDGAED